MTDERYNGWENYETWCVNLWLTNDQFTDMLCHEIVKEADTVFQAADRMREYIEMGMPDDIKKLGMFLDLANHALSRVNWFEIANSFSED